MSKADTINNEGGGFTPPQWIKQGVAALSLIAVSIAGSFGLQTTTAKNTPAVIAPAIEEVQRTQADINARMQMIERASDRQAASVEHIVQTLGQLVQETRENSAQVQRMAGAMEQMNP